MITFALIISLMFTFVAASATSDAEDAAASLNALGLFQGVATKPDGSPDFALDRTATRAEAVVMLVRLIGKEAEALGRTYAVPFTDVPGWARPYVGYAFANNLVLGINDAAFGSEREVTASEFLTFVLRAIGYESDIDFEWEKAWILSDEIGITNGSYSDATQQFRRGDVALISLNALSAKLKDSVRTLSTALIEAKAFTEDDAIKLGIGVISDPLVPLAENAPPQAPVEDMTPGASQFEKEVFDLINKERTDRDLRALDWDAELAAVARAHSQDMVQRGYFSHISADGLRPAERKWAADIDFMYSAENIARGYRTPEGAVAGWMASPSHRGAILSESSVYMGIGVHDYHWTANFIG